MMFTPINRQKSKAHLQDFIWACVFMGILAAGFFLVGNVAMVGSWFAWLGGL